MSEDAEFPVDGDKAIDMDVANVAHPTMTIISNHDRPSAENENE